MNNWSSLKFFELEKTSTYESNNKKSTNQTLIYNKTIHSPFRYLAYREIPSLIKKYVTGKNTLDYGVGTGISTQFLINQNLKVTGVDIDEKMLTQARFNCPFTFFGLIREGSIPSISKRYDFIFSSFVLFECSSKEGIVKYLREAKRVMKQDGILIAITGSQELYSRNWFIWDTNYSENQNLKSGDKAKLFLKDLNIEFTDYYWTKTDYLQCFNKAGFKLIEQYGPLGKTNEPYQWKDEKKYSPFVIFVAKLI